VTFYHVALLNAIAKSDTIFWHFKFVIHYASSAVVVKCRPFDSCYSVT